VRRNAAGRRLYCGSRVQRYRPDPRAEGSGRCRRGPERRQGGQGRVRLQRRHGRVRRHARSRLVDPTKVTRLALQNAASVAGLLLTTEVMIADAPKDDADHGHGGPPGGGMCDMGM
jgi:hypothetical protein